MTINPEAGCIADVVAKARALLQAVDFDNNGTIIGMVRQGGNGGLLSRETTISADALRLALDTLDASAVEVQG